MKTTITTDQQEIKAYNFKYSKPMYSGQTSKRTGFDVIMVQYQLGNKTVRQPAVTYYYPNYENNTTNIVRKLFDSLDNLSLDLVNHLEPESPTLPK